MQQPTPKIDLLQKLTAVLSLDQAMMLVDALSRTQGRAVERNCDQSVEIVFNGRGFPVFINSSDNVRLPKPITE